MNLHGTTKTVLRGKNVALDVHITCKQRSQINKHHFHMLIKYKIKSKASKRKIIKIKI